MYKIIILSLFLQSVCFSQQSNLSKAVNYISDFIASDYFLKLKKNNNDIALIDTIYLHTLKYKNYDYSETLLALTFAAVPYKEVPIKLPLINCIVYYPLISAGDSIFLLKNKNLPKDLFFDTPQNNYGDIDKMAHFFGSAFISYSSNIFDLGDLIGYFVESFENTFKIQSLIDERDLRTNKLGNIFGKLLRKNENALPSRLFLIKPLCYFRYNL